MTVRRVCVFCGSSPGSSPLYAQHAQQFGALLAEHGIGVVYGGGNVGLMGALADAALAAGGEVIGVIPTALVTRELAHHGLSEMVEVASMHDRKARMASQSDAFVALPGGFGTLEELFEVVTWGQLGIHNKPVGLLNSGGYWDPLVQVVQRAVADGFVRPDQAERLLVRAEPAALLDAILAYQPALPEVRWITPAQT